MDKMKLWWWSKVDLVKTVLFNWFAPNLYKLLKSRYDEMVTQMAELDEQYEADLNELIEERDDYKQKYLGLYTRIQEMAERIVE